MLIYQRYIIRNTLLPLFLITIILTGIVWITQILKLLYIIDKGVSLNQFFSLIILILPALLFIILPFISVLAIVYVYNTLGQEKQLIILKNSGLDNLKLAKPALLIAFLVTLVAYYISSQLMPWTYRKLKSDLSYIKSTFASNFITEKTLNPLFKNISFYIDKKLQDGTLQGLIVFDNREKLNQVILFAQKGALEVCNDGMVLELFHGSRQAYDYNGNLTKLYFDNLRIVLNNQKQAFANQKLYNRDINEYYISELFNGNSQLSQARRIKLLAEGHQRLIWPFYSFILTFLGLAIFLKQPYNKKSYSKGIMFTAIAILIVTYLHFTILNIATKHLSFIYGCYVNIIITMIFGLYLYKHKAI